MVVRIISLTLDHINDRLVQTDGQLCRVLLPGGQLEEQGRLVDLRDLLVDGDVQSRGLVARTVPAKEVHLGEDLFELLLLGVVILSVYDDTPVHGSEVKLEAVHQLDVSSVLFADESPVHLDRSALLGLGPEPGEHYRLQSGRGEYRPGPVL